MPTTPQSACAVTLCLLLSGCSTFFPVFEQVSVEGDGSGEVSKDGAVPGQPRDSSFSDLGEEDCSKNAAPGRARTCWDFSKYGNASDNPEWKLADKSKWNFLQAPGYLSIGECPLNRNCDIDPKKFDAEIPTYNGDKSIVSVLVRITHDVMLETGYLGKITVNGNDKVSVLLVQVSTGITEFNVPLLQLDMGLSKFSMKFTLTRATSPELIENTNFLWKIKRLEIIPVCATGHSSCALTL